MSEQTKDTGGSRTPDAFTAALRWVIALALTVGSLRDTSKQQLDFLLFLDTFPGGERAEFVEEAAFLESVDRPRAFNE